MDCVVDYRKQDWWNSPAFRSTPFDVIVDCVGGGGHYSKACGGASGKVLKSASKGGRFVAPAGDDPNPMAKTLIQVNIDLSYLIIATARLRPELSSSTLCLSRASF